MKCSSDSSRAPRKWSKNECKVNKKKLALSVLLHSNKTHWMRELCQPPNCTSAQLFGFYLLDNNIVESDNAHQTSISQQVTFWASRRARSRAPVFVCVCTLCTHKPNENVNRNWNWNGMIWYESCTISCSSEIAMRNRVEWVQWKYQINEVYFTIARFVSSGDFGLITL